MTTVLIDSSGNPLTIRRGTSPTHVFNVVEAGTDTPKNLTGATEVTFAIARRRGATTRDLMLTLGSGVTHDGDGGVVSVAFTDEQTEALAPGERWCELWITDLNDVRDLVAEGVCTVHDSLVTVP